MGAGSNNTSALASGGNASPVTVATEEWNTGIPVGAWSTGGDLNTAKRNTFAYGDTESSIISGGSPALAETESYNGSTWTEVNDMNTGRTSGASCGTDTSGLAVNGGAPARVTNTESWNGTCWTEVNDTNDTTYGNTGAGADNTSALEFGGNPGPGIGSALTESWNGTCWTEVNDLNSARASMGGAGTQTAALAFAGFQYPPASPVGGQTLTEEWNGTCW